MERAEGLRRDVIYAYDLELPEDFQPAPGRWRGRAFRSSGPCPACCNVLATTDDFKFNVALVLIDLLIRFGVIEGEAAETLRAALADRKKVAAF